MRLSKKAGLGILVGTYLTASTAGIALAARDSIAEKNSQTSRYSSLEDRARARIEAMERASKSYSRLTPEQIALGIMCISKSSEEISPSYYK